MARGWESKSVEQQQEERSEQRKTVRAPLSPDEQQRNRKARGPACFRGNASAQQLQAASNPRHRQMLEQAIAELDSQLSSLNKLRTRWLAKVSGFAHTPYNENHGPVRHLTYNRPVDESLRLRVAEEERSGSAG
jgi:predicted component of type VI protein secretion system